MTGGNPEPAIVKHYCRCGQFFATHTGWVFHRDRARIRCREVGAREWTQRFGTHRVAA